MGSSSRVKRAVQIQKSIGQLLFKEWYPIGLNDNLKLADEYDSYTGPVYRILVGSRSEEDLITYLYKIERDIIGMPCKSPDLLRPLAKKLLALDVKLSKD